MENSNVQQKAVCSICGKEDYTRHLQEGRHLSCYNKELFEAIKITKKKNGDYNEVKD